MQVFQNWPTMLLKNYLRFRLFMQKLMRDQNPATEHDLKKYYPHHYQKTQKARREGIYNYILAEP